MRALAFNFKEWFKKAESWDSLLEAVINKDEQGRPMQLDLHFPNGETRPPVCRLTGKEFSGPGLICFDFDQTLTTAWYGHPDLPDDKGGHSTANPNPLMLKKVTEQAGSNNKLVIVTARGEKEGQLTGDKTHYKGLQPVLTPDETLPYSGALPGGGLNPSRPSGKRNWHPNILSNPAWRPIVTHMKPEDVFHLGPVSMGLGGHNATESKGPFIASKMALFKCEWGILYDDGMSNVRSANAQQKKGIALVGIPVSQNWEAGGAPPAGAEIKRSASGM